MNLSIPDKPTFYPLVLPDEPFAIHSQRENIDLWSFVKPRYLIETIFIFQFCMTCVLCYHSWSQFCIYANFYQQIIFISIDLNSLILKLLLKIHHSKQEGGVFILWYINKTVLFTFLSKRENVDILW